MKKIIAMLLCLAFVISTLASCGSGDEPTVEDTSAETSAVPESTDYPAPDLTPKYTLDLTGVGALDYATLGEGYSYMTGTDETMKYLDQSKESFLGVCKNIVDGGYELYGYNEMGNVLAATYVKGAEMMHVYWIGGELNELAIVRSSTGADTLPPAVPEVITGKYDTIATQMRAIESNASTRINGMGYVIRLADGSFIIYDGGYATRLEELWEILTTFNGGEDGIVIRAWFITHAHGDHDQCFVAFANKYASKVTLETLLVAPTIDTDNDKYLQCIEKFKGAQICYLHTGMVFRFCDVTMEILCAPDDIYYNKECEDSEFNNTSVVSRVYKDNGKSFMVLGDAGDDVSTKLIPMYGEYLQSDICQASHHGVEDFTVEAYRLIRSAIWFYPCNFELYSKFNRDGEIRREIKKAEYTEEIYLHDGKTRPEISLNP